MLISYFKGGLKNGKPINCTNGSKLNIVNADELLNSQKLFNTGIKHSWGSMYAFAANKAYSIDDIKANNITTDGACFIDIDNLTSEQFNIIFNNFNKLCAKCNFIYACWPSYSTTGLHFICQTAPLNADEYERTELIILMYIGYWVNKLFNIELTENYNLDDHNKSIKQQLFLNPVSDVLFNNNCEQLDKNQDLTEIVEHLADIYPALGAKLNKPQYNINNNDSTIYLTGKDPITTKVRHLERGQRWKLFIDLNKLFKSPEAVKNEWVYCMSHMQTRKHSVTQLINQPYDEHWDDPSNKAYNDSNLLKLFGYKVGVANNTQPEQVDDLTKYNNKPIYNTMSTSGQGTKIEVGHYLSDEPYLTKIKNVITRNIASCIVAPTGTGKTTMLNNLIKGSTDIILTPFRIMRNLYSSDNCTMVDTYDEYDPTQPSVMTYDRFARVNYAQIAGKTVYIDECHILFMDRNYRDRLVAVLDKLLQLKNDHQIRIVLVSATPLDEVNILGCTEVIQFWQPRTIMNLWWVDSTNPKQKIEQTVNGYLYNTHPYDRIIVFSDLAVRMVYDNKRIELMDDCANKIAILHSDYKWTGDSEQITTTELLTKPVTLGTSLVFNGLNFKNKNEHNLVVIDIKFGDDLAWKVIQAAGRLRNCTMDILVVSSTKKPSQYDLDEQKRLANAYQEIGVDHRIFNYNGKLNNEHILNALKQIDEYKTKYSTLDNILVELRNTGYINVVSIKGEDDGPNIKIVNKLKKDANDIIKQEMVNNKLGEHNQDEFASKAYYQKLLNTIKNFATDYNVPESIIGYNVINDPTRTMVQTCINNIRNVIICAEYADDAWTDLVNRLEQSWQHQEPFIIKEQKTALKNNNKLHSKYAPVFNQPCPLLKLFNPTQKGCRTRVIAQYTMDRIANNKNILNKRAEGGAKGGVKAQPVCVQNINTGEVNMFTNKTDAMHFIGCSSKAFAQLVKGQPSKKYSQYKVVDCNCLKAA